MFDAERIDVDGRRPVTDLPCDRAASPEELLISPDLKVLQEFRAAFREDPFKHPLVVVLKNFYVGYAHLHAQSTALVGLPRQVFAVFSWHGDSSVEKQQPAIVFAVESGSATVTLQPSAFFFPRGHLSPEWWTVVNRDMVRSMSDASSDDGMFTELGEQGVKKILECQSMLTKVKEAEGLERMWGGPSSVPFAFWTILTDGLAAESRSFPSGLERIGTALEYALGVGCHSGPRLLADFVKQSGSGHHGRWEAACLERTGKVWLKTRNLKGKAFQMEASDCASAFYVDLMNMKTMKDRISKPDLHVSKFDAWIFICLIEVDFRSREWKLLDLFVPSWLRDVRFDEKSKFIVLVVSKSKGEGKYALVSFVPKFGLECSATFLSRNGTLAKRSAVFLGAHLKICAPNLWHGINTKVSSDHVRFRVDEPPGAWLRSVSGFETVKKFCNQVRWLLPDAPKDGNC
jgi:hypothetical protein